MPTAFKRSKKVNCAIKIPKKVSKIIIIMHSTLSWVSGGGRFIGSFVCIVPCKIGSATLLAIGEYLRKYFLIHPNSLSCLDQFLFPI